jgi:predicted MFS family arabinose efflux permease
MIASFFNWHWIFGINVPVILPVLAASYFFIPGEKMNRAFRVNPLAACWLTASLLLCCFGIHELTTLGWAALSLLAAGVISGIILLRWDGHQPHPFFGGRIFSPLSGYWALGASFVLGASFLSFVFLCTLALFEVMHWDVRSIGLLLFPYSIGSAFVSKFFLPWLFARMRVSRAALLALTCLVGGLLLLLAGIEARQLAYFLVALFLVNSVCISIAYPALTILTLTDVPPARQGIAAGLQSATYSIGSSVGLSLVGLCLQSPGPSVTALSLTCMVITALCAIAPVLLAKL